MESVEGMDLVALTQIEKVSIPMFPFYSHSQPLSFQKNIKQSKRSPPVVNVINLFEVFFLIIILVIVNLVQ